jgi:GTP-binding protein EngB required for normal cell division
VSDLLSFPRPNRASAVAGARLARMADIADELGDEAAAQEAHREHARLAEARFFVACVGQFKRGKSTLLNALIGRDILPVGVVPVTSMITVLRYGDVPAAFVTFRDEHTEPLPLAEVARLVDERENPGNHRAATVVEVLWPAPILQHGLCLVDTPGVGSVVAANTAATRAFVPHLDVALLVVGPDPPISGVELDLLEETAREAGRVLLVLNKADQVSGAQQQEIVAFTRAAIEGRLSQPIEQLFVVSARERVEQETPTRDWSRLEDYLTRLPREQGAALVEAASLRAVRRIGRRLRAEIQSHETALEQPLAETEARAARLRAALADVDRSLRDLRFLFDAAEADLSAAFEAECARFVEQASPAARSALDAWLQRRAAVHPRMVRRDWLSEARRLAEGAVQDWLTAEESLAERLYTRTTERFVEAANGFLARVAADAGETASDDIALEEGFQARRQFFFASLMHVGSPGALAWVLDRLLPAAVVRARVSESAADYLTHLLWTNSHRVANDLKDRVRESRRTLEATIRRRLEAATAAAERALSLATAKHYMEESEVRSRLERLHALAHELGTIALE